MKAIRVFETGGPEKLIYEDIPAPSPGPGEALVKIQAIGLNFIDVYHRTGLYPQPMPFIPGVEGAVLLEFLIDSLLEPLRGGLSHAVHLRIADVFEQVRIARS